MHHHKTISRLRRAQLSTPGDQPSKIEKAARSQADQIICDLEDSVSASAKPAARQTICDALNQLDWHGKTRSVRINQAGSPWCRDDIITLLENAADQLDTIILAKPIDVADVLRADQLIAEMEAKLKLKKHIGLELLIEDVRALQNIAALANSCGRIEALIFGAADYAASQGMQESLNAYDDIFYYPRFQIAMTARAANIDAIDSPLFDFHDEKTLYRECQRARALGMSGKMVIHPAQIEIAQAAFTPSAEQIAQARKIIKAYDDAANAGAINVDGVMVDQANIRSYQNILDKAELIKTSSQR